MTLQADLLTIERRLSILVIAPELPRPDMNAGDHRLFAMMKIIAMHHAVYLFVINTDLNLPDLDRYKKELQRIGVNVLEGNHEKFELVVAQRVYDVAVFEFWTNAEWTGAILRRQQPWVHTIVDSVDLHFLREEAGLAVGVSDRETVEANKKKELAIYRWADTVLVVTSEEQSQLRTNGVDSTTVLIPMIMSRQSRPEQERTHELLFVGGFRHVPNADGILWFTNEVWPSIRAQVADTKLTIVGSHATLEVQQLSKIPGVNFVGFVPEIKPYLDQASLSIAPLRFGAGMKGKVTEAMAAGLPVITTTFGAQGLEAESGKHLIVTDDPRDFADQVVTLLNDEKLANEIGEAGQKHIENICGIEVVERRLTGLFATLKPSQSYKRLISKHAVLILFKIKAYVKLGLRYVKKRGKATLLSTLSPVNRISKMS